MNFFRMIEGVRRSGAGGLRDPDRLGAWLVATVRNALHDEYRKTTRRAALTERAAAMAVPDGTAAEPDFLAGIYRERYRPFLDKAETAGPAAGTPSR